MRKRNEDNQDAPEARPSSALPDLANISGISPEQNARIIEGNLLSKRIAAKEALWRAGRSGGDASHLGAGNGSRDVPGVDYDAPLRLARFQRETNGPLIPLSDSSAPTAPASPPYQSSDPGIPLSDPKSSPVAPKWKGPRDPGIPLSDSKSSVSYGLEPESGPGASDAGISLSSKRKKGYGLEPESPHAIAAPAAFKEADAALAKLNQSADEFPGKIKQIGNLFTDLQGAVKKFESALADTSGTATEQALRKKVASANLDDKIAAANLGPQDAPAKSEGMPAMLQSLISGLAFKVAGPTGGMVATALTGKDGPLSGIGKTLGFGAKAAATEAAAPGAEAVGGAETVSGAGGAGAGLAAAAGPIGLVAIAALAVNAGLGIVADGLGSANRVTTDFAEGMAKTAGVPKSIADLGGAVMGLFSPLHVAEIGVKAFQFALLPLLNLDKPGELVKDVLGGIANVGGKLATVFLDMRDPAAMLSQAIGPFVNQVGKFNPAAVERMNIAFDNLSAAAGRMFTPIIAAVTAFADDLNVLYTAFAGPAQALIGSAMGPIKAIALEFAYGMAGLAIQSIPTLQKAFMELQPVARDFGRFVITASGWVIEAFGKVVSCIQPGIALLNEWWPTIKAMTIGALILAGMSAAGALVVLWPLTALAAAAIAAAYGLGKLAQWLVSDGPGTGTANKAPTVTNEGTSKEIRDRAEYERRERAEQLAADQRRRDMTFFPSSGPGWQLRAQEIANRNMIYGRPHDLQGRPVTQTAPAAAPAAANPAMTVAAQPARHVGIEDVGLEARRSAFSQGSDAATQTATNTGNTATNTGEMLRTLQALATQLGIYVGAQQAATASTS